MAGRANGDLLVSLDLDPYPIAIDNVSTHIIGTKLNEVAIRDDVANGHAYVSHDWICDPRGFLAWLDDANGETIAILGDEATFAKGQVLKAQFPMRCDVRLLRNGKVIDEKATANYSFEVKEAGVYRFEGWLTVDGEERPWIYANPVYIR
jgi:hypothetical protein